MNFWEFIHEKTKGWGSDDFVFFFVFAVIPLAIVVGSVVVAVIHGLK